MKINRESILNDLEEFTTNGSGVIIGRPGVGKTYLLASLCRRFEDKGIPHLILPIDKLGEGTDEELRIELSLQDDLISWLKNGAVQLKTLPAVLIFDAYDAARSEQKQRCFLHIIQRAVLELSGLYNVIVTVRTFDAKKSRQLLNLFGKPLSSDTPNYQDSDILCRHFLIPPLNDSELAQVFNQIPNLDSIYKNGSHELQDLLRIPFNLWLMERILTTNTNIPDFSKVRSEVQLLGLYWEQRIKFKINRNDREFILTKVARRMVNERSLSIRKEDIYRPEISQVWDDLQSDEILTEISLTGQKIAFSHNILFDYAISVLLIEDQPERLVEFIAEDPAQLVFLRPSLTYYLTRLWYDEPKIFWIMFWHTIPSSTPHMRLFSRLLPPSVIANEATSIGELTPMLESLTKGNIYAIEAVLRVLQALNTLQIIRDELWVPFLDKLSEHLHRDFAWDLATLTLDIVDRLKGSNDRQALFQVCGLIGRRLLRWIWNERQENGNAWIDSLGSNKTVPLVAKTFGTNKKESRILLGEVLQLTQEEKFPISFLYQLTSHLENIWPHDSEFVYLVYITVFSHYETSSDKTSFGTPVLPMTSTRRQDYEMCHYILETDFPKFLYSVRNYKVATKTVIESLNHYIIRTHIIGYLKEGDRSEDIREEFYFRGKTISIIPDNSYIWDESEHIDQPIKMADELFTFINKLASAPSKSNKLDSILNVFRDHVVVSFFWKRLLQIAAKSPKIFANRLFELCIARPIQTRPETIHALGLFIEAAAPELSSDQVRQIEISILVIPNDETEPKRRESLEHIRNRLLARIPLKLIITPEGKRLRKSLLKDPTAVRNEPLVTFKSWSEPYSHEKWLQEQGADLSCPESQELQEYFDPLDQFTKEWQNQTPSIEAVKLIFPVTTRAYDVIKENAKADKAVINSTWSILAACVGTMIRAIDNPDSEEFTFARKVVLECSQHELPEPDPEYDSKYDSPHWTNAPRNEAALALPWLISIKADEEMLSAIETLIHDKVPSVRLLVTMELRRIFRTDKEAFWRMAKYIAEKETNKVVLDALCRSIGSVISHDKDTAIQVLSILVDKSLKEDNHTQLLDSLVSLVMWLLIAQKNHWAIGVIDTYTAIPVPSAKVLNRAVLDALSFVTPQQISIEKQTKTVSRAIQWLHTAIDAAISSINELIERTKGQWNEESQTLLKDIYEIIDAIVTRLYFAADVSDRLQTKEEHITDEKREKFYWAVKPLLEHVLSFTTDKDNGILFAPTAHHFMEMLNGVIKYDPKGVLHMAAGVAESSKAMGYNLDPLAIREVVKLVETTITDYRLEARDGESLQDLLVLLDVFAESGWAEAIQLVWRLDEIFR